MDVPIVHVQAQQVPIGGSMKFYIRRFCRFPLSLVVAICLITSFFGWESHLAAQAPIIKNIQIAQPEKKGFSNKDMQIICTAAIAAVFQQPAANIHVGATEKGMMHLSYTLPTDGSVWQYQCKIEGQRVILATKESPSQTNTPDEQVTFQLTKDEVFITVTSPDGSERQSRFPR